MYGQGSVTTVVTGGTVTSAGIITLPFTSGNILAMILSYSAIAIGASVIVSQVVVRIVRRKYQG